MLARGGGGGKKTAMGQKIIAILPYIKQVPLFHSSIVTIDELIYDVSKFRKFRL